MNKYFIIGLIFFLQTTLYAEEHRLPEPYGSKKILVLIIASDNLPVYGHLQSIWREYMHRNPEHVEAYFIKADPNLDTECKIEGDIIWSKTNESLVPGILIKTLLSMKCFMPRIHEFDYVLRTNLSSFYVFPRLLQFIQTIPIKRCYCAVPITLGKKTSFGSGAGFLLSPDVVELLVKDQNDILNNHANHEDDVAIGLHLKRRGINIHRAQRMDLLTLKSWFEKKNKIPHQHYHFRVKNPDSNLRVTDDVFIQTELLKMFYP